MHVVVWHEAHLHGPMPTAVDWGQGQAQGLAQALVLVQVGALLKVWAPGRAGAVVALFVQALLVVQLVWPQGSIQTLVQLVQLASAAFAACTVAAVAVLAVVDSTPAKRLGVGSIQSTPLLASLRPQHPLLVQ